MRFHDWEEIERDSSRFIKNLDLNLLRVFSEIVKSGGVTRAAHAMSRQQPSVSAALKRLEEYLGVVLCHRGPSGFELTEYGRVMAKVCQSIDASLEMVPGQFMKAASAIEVQLRVVTVGNVVSTPLDVALAQFCQTYPRAEILINVASWMSIERALLASEAEIGIAPSPGLHDDLTYIFLYREKNVPLCGASHPLFGKRFDNPSMLADESFVLLGDGEAPAVRDFRVAHGWGSHSVGQSLDPNEVKRMVIAGTGIGFLPREFLEPDIEAGRLWELMSPPSDAEMDIYAIAAPSGPRFEAVKILLDLLKDGQSPAAEAESSPNAAAI